MCHKLFIFLICFVVILAGVFLYRPRKKALPPPKKVLGVIAYRNDPTTQSCFYQKLEEEVEIIPFPTEYKETEKLELGNWEIKQPGVDGRVKSLKIWEVSLWVKNGRLTGRRSIFCLTSFSSPKPVNLRA
jgi:hypothetical protein